MFALIWLILHKQTLFQRRLRKIEYFIDNLGMKLILIKRWICIQFGHLNHDLRWYS